MFHHICTEKKDGTMHDCQHGSSGAQWRLDFFFVEKGRTLTSGRCVGVKVRGTVFTQRVIYIYIYIEREREREMNVVLAAW
jgi:hypothetical protein